MAEVPSWAGPVGSTLVKAADAFLQGMMGPSFEEERQARERKALKETADIELQKAHADSYRNLHKGAVPDYLETKWGVYIKNPVSGQLELKHRAPPETESDPGKVAKWLALKGLEQKLGKPQSAFTYEDQLNPDPDVQGLWDRFHGRSNITIVPGVGPYLTRDVRGGTTASPQSPTAEPSAAPVAKSPSPGAKQPAVDPSLPIVNGPPVSTEPLRTNKPDAGKKPAPTEGQADPKIVTYYNDRFRAIPQAQAGKEVDALMHTKGIKPQQVASALEAYHRTYGVHAPGVSAVQDALAPPAQKPPEKPAAQGQPEGSPRVVQPLITSPAQQEEQARKRAGDEREQMRLRLQQQGLSLQEQESRLRELDRQEHKRQWEVEQKLREEKVARDIQELENANKRKDEAAAFRVTQRVMQETREARGMIQGVDETVALIQEMRRYISPETVGVKGAVRGAWQSVWGQLTDSAATKPLQGNAATVQRLAMETAGRHAQEAEQFGGTWQLEENERARAEGRAPSKIYIPDYSKYGYDPRMRFIDFLKEVIAYAHARAMNGPGRLTDQDLNRAQKSLGIDGWINSAADMQTSIGYVEQQLKAKKARAQAYAASVEKTLRKHRPGAVEAGGEDVPPPPEE